MNGDEGQAMRAKRWNRWERGLEGGLLPSLQEERACWRNGGLQEGLLAGETGAGALIINFLLILLWIEMKL